MLLVLLCPRLALVLLLMSVLVCPRLVVIHSCSFFFLVSGGKSRECSDKPEDDESHRERHPSERAARRGDDRGRNHLRPLGRARGWNGRAPAQLPRLPRSGSLWR